MPQRRIDIIYPGNADSTSTVFLQEFVKFSIHPEATSTRVTKAKINFDCIHVFKIKISLFKAVTKIEFRFFKVPPAETGFRE